MRVASNVDSGGPEPADPRREPARACLVVVNPVATRYESGNVRALLDAHLQRRGGTHRLHELHAGPGCLRELEETIRDALRAGIRRLVVVGGDGTVSLTGSALPRRAARPADLELAIVPAGTANVLAHELGIPMDLEAALELALDGANTLELDGIRAPGRLAFTQVGVGPDAEMIREASREDRRRRGRFAYAWAFLHRAAGHPVHSYDLVVDRRVYRARAWQVVVANAGAAGTPPFTWGPGIDPTDGTLDLCVYVARTLRDYLALAWKVASGRHRRGPQARYFRVREEVVIRSERPLLVQADGELIGRTPITLQVAPTAIRVVVPRRVDAPAVVGAPGEPSSQRAMAAAAAAVAREGEPSVARDVDVMVAQHSRTWVLQGPLRHPFARLQALDAALFLKVNALPLGVWNDRLMLALSDTMHYGEGWAAVAIAMMVSNLDVGLRATAEALVVLWSTMLTVNLVLKKIFRRRRPFAEFVKACVVGPRPNDFSLPSGHSAAAFAGALLFSAHAPAWGPVFYAIAILTAFSRVYLGVHYPSDVLLGGFVGAALAAAYRALLHLLLPRIG